MQCAEVARLNGCLGKIAQFFALLFMTTLFFVIFLILNGFCYAQIEEKNDKMIEKKHINDRANDKRYKCPFFYESENIASFFTLKKFHILGEICLFEEFGTLVLDGFSF